MSSQFLQQSAVGNGVKAFTKVQVNICTGLADMVQDLPYSLTVLKKRQPGTKEVFKTSKMVVGTYVQVTESLP